MIFLIFDFRFLIASLTRAQAVKSKIENRKSKIFLRCAALFCLAAPLLFAGDVFRMPDNLPELERRGSWQESLDDLATIGVPDTWLIVTSAAWQGKKEFEQQSSLPADRSDDWGALNPKRWTRPKDDDGCEVDLSNLVNRDKRDILFLQAMLEWPVAGPALLWFDSFARAGIYLNNSCVEYRPPHNRGGRGGTKAEPYPIPVQMLRGKNILKLKLSAPLDGNRFPMSFHLRLERNDLAWREQLFKRLCELYPDEAGGWRGAEGALELARKYEAAEKFKEALALCEKVARDFPDSVAGYAAEVQAARQRMQRPKNDPAEDSRPSWGTLKARVDALLGEGEAAAADRLLRDYAARFPFSQSTGAAVCLRGFLRQDYGLGHECQPFLERALREFRLDEQDCREALHGLASVRTSRPEQPAVPVRHELQLQIDAVRRQLTGGNAADAESGVRTVQGLMQVSGDSVLRVSDSLFTPRYAGVREYLRALLVHLGSGPLELYRASLEREAERRYQAAKAAGSILDLEAVAWEHYLTPAAAKALNQAGNLYLDSGSYDLAASVFRVLLRDYRDSGGAGPASSGDMTRFPAVRGIGIVSPELQGAMLGGLSEPLITAKLARALLQGGQMAAAREVLSRLRASAGAGRAFKVGGKLVSGADYAFNLESRIAWATLGAPGMVQVAETETYGGNARRSGPGLQSPAPKPEALAWSAGMPKSHSAEVAQGYWHEDTMFAHWQSFAVVSSGRVLTSTLESLQCLDLRTGQVTWKQVWDSKGSLWNDRFTGFPISCPTAYGERIWLRVMVADSYRSALRCYRASDGKQLWSTEGMASCRDLVWLSDPLLANGMAIAVYMELPAHGWGGPDPTNAHGLAALDAESGELRWKRALASGTTGIRVYEEGHGRQKPFSLYRGSMQLGPPATDGGVVYAATGLGSLAALNVFTGELLWMSGYPRLRVDNLRSGNSGAADFLPRMLKLNARGPCSPLLGDEVVVLAPKDAAGLFAFDRKNGAIRWSQDLLESRFLAGLCAGNVIAADNTVCAISLSTGKIAWEYSLEDKRLLGQPGFSGGMLYLPTANSLVLLDARSGQPAGTFPWDKKIGPLANLIVTGQRIVGVNAKWVGAMAPK